MRESDNLASDADQSNGRPVDRHILQGASPAVFHLSHLSHFVPLKNTHKSATFPLFPLPSQRSVTAAGKPQAPTCFTSFLPVDIFK